MAVRKHPDSGVSVGFGSLHSIAPASTSRWSADRTSCIPFRLTVAARARRDREGMTLVWTRTPVAYREMDRDPGSQTLLRCECASKWHEWMRFVPATTRAVIPRAAPLPAPADAGPRASGTPAGSRLPTVRFRSHLPARFT